MGASDNAKGLALAVASSAFIGASFILKKIGLMRASKCGVRAGTSSTPRASPSLPLLTPCRISHRRRPLLDRVVLCSAPRRVALVNFESHGRSDLARPTNASDLDASFDS